MSVHEELVAEQRAAMKAGDKPKVNAIRQIESEVSVAKAAAGFDPETPEDDLYNRVIRSYVKKMEKARLEYIDLGEVGAAQAEKLAFEVEYLSRWLAEATVDEDATRALVKAAISELGVDDPKQIGRVTGYVLQSTEGLDGALVNHMVREELGGS